MIPEVAYEHYFKVPVIKTKDYVVLLEQHVDVGTLIHCDMYRWSKEIAKRFLRDLNILYQLHGGPIHALHDSKDRKHEKFIKLCGFTKARDLGDHQELWIWSK